MILSDKDIKKALKTREIKLVPLEQSQICSASVDLTLSNEWYHFKKEFKSKKTVDLSKVGFEKTFELRRSPSVTLDPGQMCLGKTVEKITLPGNIMGKLEGRSRYARMGVIIHTTSALVQPGSDNRQVLEIVNLAPFPIKLSAGMRISQIVFEYLKSPTSKPYSKFGKIARKQ